MCPRKILKSTCSERPFGTVFSLKAMHMTDRIQEVIIILIAATVQPMAKFTIARVFFVPRQISKKLAGCLRVLKECTSRNTHKGCRVVLASNQ